MGLRDKALELRKQAQKQQTETPAEEKGLREKAAEAKQTPKISPEAEKILGLLHYRLGSIKYGDIAKTLNTSKKQAGDLAIELEDKGLVEIKEKKLKDNEIRITEDTLERIRSLTSQKPREKVIIIKPKPEEKPAEEETGKEDAEPDKPPREQILELLEYKENAIPIKEAAEKLKQETETIEEWAKDLYDAGLVEIHKKPFGPDEIRITKKTIRKIRRTQSLPAVEREQDIILDTIPAKGKISLKDIAKKRGLSKDDANKYASDLNKDGLVKINRSLILFGAKTLKPTKKLARVRENISLIEQFRKTQAEKDEKNEIERITTQVDDLVRLVRNRKEVEINELAITLGTDEQVIEEWSTLIADLIKIDYPLNIAGKPKVKIVKEIHDERPFIAGTGEIKEDYTIESDNVPARIRIYDSPQESMPLYIVNTPRLGEATENMILALADKLTDRISIDIEEITDTKKMLLLKDKFYSEAKQLIDEEMPANEVDKEVIAGMLLHATYGLGDVEILMNDDWLEEIGINTANVPLTAYHKKFGWTKTNLFLDGERVIYNYATQIGRKIGRNITALDPIMDAHLLTGDRVCATLFPISSLGNTITIRRFARSPWTLIHFISPKFFTLNKEIAAFLWLCFQYELNVMVGGGTASGKTSMLSSLCTLIQPTQRVITIEDTREINLPKNMHWNWIPLTTRQPNPEGKGEVSMLDLIVTSLRMRPDRIILGEIRRKREAEVLFEAMHTGHSVYGTFHADTARNLKRRLTEPPIDIPPAEVEALHLIIIQYRDRATGGRKTFEVAEVVPAAEGREFQLNYLFRWNSREQKFVKINESIRVFNDLNLHTGMNREEINQNLKEKEEVLQWMLDNEINNIDQVGKVIEEYYKDDKHVVEIARRNGKFEEL